DSILGESDQIIPRPQDYRPDAARYALVGQVKGFRLAAARLGVQDQDRLGRIRSVAGRDGGRHIRARRQSLRWKPGPPPPGPAPPGPAPRDPAPRGPIGGADRLGGAPERV